MLVVLALGLVTAGLSAPTWVVATGVSASAPVAVTGTTAAPQVLAVALMVLAAGAALALVGRAGRWVVVLVLAAGGALVAVTAVGVLVDPAGAAADAVARSTGLTGLAGAPRTSVWPWLTAVAGAGLVVCGAGLARAGRRWPATTRRHEREPDERSDWDALSQGRDPSDPHDGALD
ncbi:MAG: Trp biosynthesis-associated membrane protein [Actinobacteria bacterium]|nr:Trp biosynthesis-associated membrane protein [Actinomycetota bacterium]MCG2802210.1 Trp biosynthesis-associated membrane protein [Cellulomonas sp.]